jgi:hypothetical protein
VDTANKSNKDLLAKLSAKRPEWKHSFWQWFASQTLLLEALLVAMCLHVLLLPMMWVAGWALPWPKPPVITTIVEWDLTNWPKVTKPKSIYEVRDPKKNKPD